MSRHGIARFSNNEKGMVLAVVLMVMVILTLIGVLGISRVRREIGSQTGASRDIGSAMEYRRDTQTFYIAESGIFKAAAYVNDTITFDPTGAAGFTNEPFKNGAFTVTRTDPDANRMILTSVGQLTGHPDTVTLQAIGLKVGAPPPLFDFAIFSAQNITLDGNMKVNGGNVYSGGNINVSTQNAVVGGSISAYGNVSYAMGNSSIKDGSVFAHGTVSLTNQNNVRVSNGNVYAGSTVSGNDFAQQVTGGTVTQSQSPAPVNPVSYYEDNYKITDSGFNDLYNKAATQGNVHVGNFSPPVGNYTGIHYVTGDLRISGNFSGDAMWVVAGNLVVDGNIDVAADKIFTFVVKGNVDSTGLGAGSIDAFVYANGTISGTGNSTVNGGVISFGGVVGSGGYTVNYKTPSYTEELPGSGLKFQIISLAKQ